jgi:hypothetical protein
MVHFKGAWGRDNNSARRSSRASPSAPYNTKAPQPAGSTLPCRRPKHRNLTLTRLTAGMPAGQFSATVRLSSPDADGGPRLVPVSLTLE